MERPYKIKQPKDLADYIIKTVADHTYLIVDRKADRCRCTRCGAENKISEMHDGEALKHNAKHYCYECCKDAIVKEFSYGRKNITEYGRILWFRKHGRVTFAELDEYQINYTGWEPKVSFWPSAQYRFTKESQEYYKHTPEGCWSPDRWERRKDVKLPYATGGMWNYNCVPRYQKTVTHPSFLRERGSDLKYANLDMLRLGFEAPDNPYRLICYIYNFLKYPSIEVLEKAGFERIVGERASEEKSRTVNWRAKDLRKILGLKPKEIKEFRELGRYARLYELEKYKDIKKMGYKVSFDQLNLLPDYKMKEKIQEIERYVKLEKALSYLETQGRDCGIYLDYLRECSKLGYDMKNKKVLFPAELQAAHEETSEKIRIQADSKKKVAFKKSTDKIYDRPAYREEKLLIRAAQSPEELAKESAALHHCVRNYVDSVANGICAILFIRKTESPDKPYFTLELSPDGKIVQCRGDHNCAYPDDVKEFLERWQEWMKTKKKKEAA